MKKFLLRILLTAMGLLSVAGGSPAFALDLGRVDSDGLAVSLDHGNMSVFGRYNFGTLWENNDVHAVRCTYDFATLGGAALAAVNLQGSTIYSGSTTLSTCKLPQGAVVTSVFLDVITSLAVGSTTTAVSVSSGLSVGDLYATVASSSVTAGIRAGVPVGTAASALKITADSTPQINTGAWPLTGGKFYVLIQYLMSQTL